MATPIQKKPRTFVAENIEIQEWTDLAPYFEKLLSAEILNVQDLEQWLKDRSELESVVGEDYRWKYIHQSCDTKSVEKENALNAFIEKIMPLWMQVSNQLNQKVVESEFLEQLDPKEFKIYIRNLKNELEIFRQENIPLMTEVDKLSNEYGKISGAMTIEYDGATLTLQQAQKLLQNKDRKLRKTVFEKIQQRRSQDKEQLEDLFDQLLQLRHQIAVNAGFDNFRDYMMKALGRFDYNVQDCENFHKSIARVIVPVLRKIHEERLEQLQFSSLQPYDMDVPIFGDTPLTPFQNADELLQKSIVTLNHIDDYFGYCVETMQAMHHLDLDSRVGKRPGGYNMPLPEIGVPFIFMNAAGTQGDVTTMLHESGHAIHSFLTKDLTYNFEKEFSSEVAELASMSMELMSMDYWNEFYQDEEQLKRAKREQMERVISVLPWIAIVDKFQHWIYTHPTHTRAERRAEWKKILAEFSTEVVDWSDYEAFLDYSWHRQLHIFEVPFYYIEYGIAQLGAVGIWKNYRKNASQAVQQYKAALSLGGRVSIPEVYATAGIQFDFTEKNIQGLADLLVNEL